MAYLTGGCVRLRSEEELTEYLIEFIKTDYPNLKGDEFYYAIWTYDNCGNQIFLDDGYC
jgi:hypothetical protein